VDDTTPPGARSDFPHFLPTPRVRKTAVWGRTWVSGGERVGYIGGVRRIARKAALAYHHLRAELGYPLIPDKLERERWLEHYLDTQSRNQAQAAKRAAKEGAR